MLNNAIRPEDMGVPSWRLHQLTGDKAGLWSGSKEGLFVAVLGSICRRMDRAEAKVSPDPSDRVEALKVLIPFKLDYYRRNPDFVNLLNTENLHKGKHVSGSVPRGEFSYRAVRIVEGIVTSGIERGLFCPTLTARDVFLLIASPAYFYSSNRYALSVFLGEDLDSPDAVEHWKSFVIDSVLRTVRADLPKSGAAA
ncbi:hypothetical protein [Cupriavidus pauculus]|uniref:hypothetical protein n=1 Tax=Cupriavidus pauculus TaxID=82633 RepID=UPI001EE1A9D2|nr:hypothetical protein [Cupriavidus pauculus]GJG98756.1 hypothetical protein CBA19C6_29725 [Cupriavidus pauculus]